MHNLSCRSARHWLQAPHELWRGDMRILDHHLASCPTCRELNARQAEMDRRLRQSLQSVGNGGSMRANVRAQIASSAAGHASPRRRQRGRWSLRSVFLPGWIGMSVALAVTVMTVFLPQYV